jgi:hypothetical protein
MIQRLNAEPDGFCRVYYRDGRGPLYCWQNDHADRWSFYRCSRDGEPSHMVVLRDQPPCPQGSPTGEWLALQGEVA